MKTNITKDRRESWKAIFAYGRRQARKLGITEKDVVRLVREVRGKTTPIT